jgi:hypothetical protein
MPWPALRLLIAAAAVAVLARPVPADAQGAAASKSAAVPAPAAPAVAASTAAVVGGGLLVSKLNLDLNPDQPGELEAAELRIPSGPDLQKIAATTSYKDRDLKIMGLDLAPEIRLRTVEFEASALNRELLKIGVDGDVFAGRANIAVQLRGLGKPPMTDVAIAFNGLSLVAALIEIGRGGVSFMSVLILGVSLVITAGLAVAIWRGGH